MKVRLNKYLSECGIASRRKSDLLIQEGRVSLNGALVFELGTKIDPEFDDIKIDGELIKSKQKIYFLLNKPKGVITSTADERNRKVVTDLIKTRERIFPIGRLDFNTTGVLLLTNDGEFSNFLTHPSNGIEREYKVVLDKPLTVEDKHKLLKGVYIEKRKSVFTKLEYPKRNNYTICIVTTVEGRNHFVKKMFDSIGYRVKELDRTKFGDFTVNGLERGEYRTLSRKELNRINYKI